MAYNKKTWKARQGLGLNKFSIDGATPVPVVNQPDSITQQGDALSAGNLNDLEQRIADAFDDVEESKADKSTTEALQSQIDQHDARLENLEQKAGDYTTVQYRGTNAVPTGKAKYGLVKSIVGKTRAWNQLCPQVTNTTTARGYSVVSSGTSTTVSGTSSATGPADILANIGSVIKGHKYLVILNLSVSSGAQPSDSTYAFKYSDGDPGNWYNEPSWIFTAGDTYVGISDLMINVRATNVATNFTITPCIYDLTLIFGAGNEPSTVADALAQLPALGQYNAYDAGSLVSTEVSGVKSVGVNIWDEEWELGNINNKTSALEPTNNAIRTTNYTKVKPNSVIYIYCGSGNKIGLFAYDENKNFIGVYVSGNFVVGSNSYTDLGNHSVTLPLNCHYIKIKFGTSYGTTYKNDTQVSVVNGSVGTLNTTYHPYKTDTLSLSETVTLRSAGSVAEVLYVETGKKTRPVKEITLTGNFVFVSSTSDWVSASVTLSDSVSVSNSDEEIRVVCSHLPSVSAKNMLTNYTRGIGIISNNRLFVLFAVTQFADVSAFNTWVNNNTVKVCYQLATPTTEQTTPVLDPFIQVEGGGTIDTIQTQTPVIDNCLDVGYLTV